MDASMDESFDRLNYADKVFTTLQRVDTTASRLSRAQVIVSITLVALATGVVSASEDREIVGLKLRLPLWIVLSGGAVTVAILSVLAASNTSYSLRLQDELLALYDEGGYSTPRSRFRRGIALMGSSGAGIIDTLDLSDVPATVVKPIRVLLYAVWLLTLLLLPFAAQVATVIKLGIDFHWPATVFALVPVALISTAAVLAFAIGRSGFEHG